MKITYKNITASYEVEGQGPALVWLHGFMENKSIWNFQRSFFSTHFTNVYIDLLGHGETEVLADTHTMEEQADLVKYILNSLDINKCSLIGHSMGGYVALAFLEAFPEHVTRIILLNSTSKADSEEKKVNRDRAVKLVQYQKDSFLKMGIVNLFGTKERAVLQKEIDALIEKLATISKEGIIAALKGMKIRANRSNTLCKFEGHKLIIAGKNDPVLQLSSLQEEAQITKSQLLEVAGGHMSYLESTDLINTKVLEFLKAV